MISWPVIAVKNACSVPGALAALAPDQRAVVVLRHRMPDLKRPYQVWGYPILPIAFTLAALVIVVNTLASKPRESIIGLALVLAGMPIFYAWRWMAGRTE